MKQLNRQEISSVAGGCSCIVGDTIVNNINGGSRVYWTEGRTAMIHNKMPMISGSGTPILEAHGRIIDNLMLDYAARNNIPVLEVF